MAPRGGPRAMAALLLLAVFLLGGLAGVALDRFVLNPKQPPRRHVSRLSPESAHRFSRYLGKELGLSAQQEAKVDSIVLFRQTETRALAKEVHPRFEALAQQTRADVEQVLTPAQKAKYEQLRARHRAQHPPDSVPAPPPSP
jgi:hypothetical protein